MKIKTVFIVLNMVLSSCNLIKQPQERMLYKLPKTAVKISRSELPANQQISSPTIGTSYTNLYKIDDQIIGLTELFKGELVSNYLENAKRDLDRLYNDIGPNAFKDYTSRIEKTNNYDILIQSFYNSIDDKNYYAFKIVNKSYTKLLSGIIQFNISEEKIAQKNLDNLLKTIQIK
jgi:hypothetical protein